MAISRRLRFEVLKRDGHRCRYCGARADEARLTVDHVVPVSLGGADDPSNLVAACAECNGGKGSVAPDSAAVAQVQADTERWGQAMREAARVQSERQGERQAYADAFLAKWNEWTFEDGTTMMLPHDWEPTLFRFHDLGLEIDAMLGAVKVAGNSHIRNKSIFKYFCGVCWRVLRERADIARSIVAGES